VTVPHPIAGNPATEVADKATAIADEVLAILTEPAERLSDQSAGRFTKPAERRLTPVAVCADEVCAIDPGQAISPVVNPSQEPR
jgi:hypothetical protein